MKLVKILALALAVSAGTQQLDATISSIVQDKGNQAAAINVLADGLASYYEKNNKKEYAWKIRLAAALGSRALVSLFHGNKPFKNLAQGVYGVAGLGTIYALAYYFYDEKTMNAESFKEFLKYYLRFDYGIQIKIQAQPHLLDIVKANE